MLIIKMLTDADGFRHSSKEWHLCVISDRARVLCSNELLLIEPVTYRVKESENGQVTCEECKKRIKEIKAVRLSKPRVIKPKFLIETK